MRKVTGCGGGWVACKIILSAPGPVPFLWTLNFGFWTCILDLDLGLGFGTGLGLDNFESRDMRTNIRLKLVELLLSHLKIYLELDKSI